MSNIKYPCRTCHKFKECGSYNRREHCSRRLSEKEFLKIVAETVKRETKVR